VSYQHATCSLLTCEAADHSFFLPRVFLTSTGFWLLSNALARLTAAYKHTMHASYTHIPINLVAGQLAKLTEWSPTHTSSDLLMTTGNPFPTISTARV